jgi:hypothetical protein
LTTLGAIPFSVNDDAQNQCRAKYNPVSTVSDLAGTFLPCLPDASVLFAAVNGGVTVPASGGIVCDNAPEAVPQAVRQ